MFLAVIMCMLVPAALAIAPFAMTRSKVAGAVIQITCVSSGVLCFLYLPDGPLRRPLLAVSLLALAQYWVICLLEKWFETRYGRAPTVNFLVSRLHIEGKDSLMTLAY